jgi:hypothetical protein
MKPLTTADPETKSADLLAENLDKLKALFSEAFTEGKIDFAVLKQFVFGMIEGHNELSPVGDIQVVFRDSAFADDVAKTSLTAILQQHGLTNVRSL